MNFEPAPFISGTCLQGHVTISYDRLVEIFGEPHSDGDAYKVDAEWDLEFEDGTVATIYNYKDGHNYCGPDGRATSKITNWHVGGRSTDAVDRVREALGL